VIKWYATAQWRVLEALADGRERPVARISVSRQQDTTTRAASHRLAELGYVTERKGPLGWCFKITKQGLKELG
jgi:hypothetical protein